VLVIEALNMIEVSPDPYLAF